MLVQLGLYQRLITIVGHPTRALSVVLFTMLLGTYLGAALSARLFPNKRASRARLNVGITGVLAAGAHADLMATIAASLAERTAGPIARRL